VLAVMKQAGRGLEAAHTAGIVHRDFKPSNVIVARDGRVCVLDFGIARSASATDASSSPTLVEGRRAVSGAVQVPAPSSASFPPGSTPSPLDVGLTEEGTIVGTPGYFASETLEGKVDARTDEFSFCVTLWRALYASPPYPSAPLSAYIASISDGPVERPAHARVPAWLHAVVRKGLDPAPERRYGSMRELLRALDADPRRSRALRAVGAVVVFAIAMAAFGVSRHRASVRAACDADGARIAAAWSASRRDETRRAILAAGDGNAEDRADRAARALDEFAVEWQREESASCAATRVASTQSEAAYERRSACLLSARQRMEVIVELLAARDSNVVRHEVELARSLPSPHLCNGSDARAAYTPLPGGAARPKAEEARRLVERAKALQIAGPSADGLAAADRAVTLAREAGDGAAEAAALLAAGKIHARRFEDATALEKASNALLLAERLGLDHLAGVAAAEKAFLLDARFEKVAEARAWLDLARAKLAHEGDDPELEQEILRVDLVIQDDEGGDRVRALAGYDTYIDFAAHRYGATDSRVCKAMSSRGRLLFMNAEYERSAEAMRDAIRCGQEAVGPGDESLGAAYNALGAVLDVLGRLDEAIAAYRHAASARAIVGPADDLACVILGNLARVENRAGHFADAELHARQALPVAEASTGFARGTVPGILFALGMARLGQGHAEEARDSCRRAVSLSDTKDTKSAERTSAYDSLRCLGEAELLLGDVTAAREHLEQSVRLTSSPYADDLPRARFDLARALATGSAADRERAARLAEQARDALRTTVDRQPWLKAMLETVERWIDAHAPGRPVRR